MKRSHLMTLAILLAPGSAHAASHYERHHPDVHFREQGLAALDRGDARAAFELFVEASRFADKPAQAMVAEAYALGRGVAADPVRAYAWMDLAAERGYPLFLGKREHLWQGLDAAQRAATASVGERIYLQFGDAAAKPRMADVLRRGTRNAAGSRHPGR